MKFATRAIHAGQPSDGATGAVVVPIFQTSTYEQDGIDKPRGGFEYARTQNPTRGALEATIASLENAAHGLCFASGSATTAAVFNLLEPGDEVITTIDVYGGTYRYLRMVLEKYGVEAQFLATSSADEILSAVTDRTKMIWIETPTNPMLNVIDIARIASGKREDVRFVVDNTFATPVFQTPLDLGADVVVHSVTKYMAGHSDLVGGALATNDEQIYEACKFYQNSAGAVPGPIDCFLVQRGIKTLELRMHKHHDNARRVASFLEESDAVEKVIFPGSPAHPNYEVAKAQMRGQSGMVSFVAKGGRKAVDEIVSRFRLFKLAESLGGVESLVCFPTRMTHHAIPESEKQKIGITESLLRLSVGIEDPDDILADLQQALGG